MKVFAWRRSFGLFGLMLAMTAAPLFAQSGSRMIGINVLLNTSPTSSVLADLAQHGNIRDVIPQINAVTIQAPESELPAIKAESYVADAAPDAERKGSPVDTVSATNFNNGINAWNLDAVNVTNFGSTTRTVPYTGAGVYVAVLDTGLLDSWRQYFPQERIATQYGIGFSGGGGDMGTVSSSPNMWEHDQNSHGTHVTSTILGFQFGTSRVNGVAPGATVIPVKVLNQTSGGWGWSSVIARGIVYVADLKAGELSASPVVINMSLGGSRLDPVEKAAIDYAISRGVVIVAAAGNEGQDGMGYPGAYAPVISVAAAGWTREWTAASWWRTLDFPDPTDVSNLYITDFSSRAKAGHDLDVTAPGSWVVGPYQINSGQTSYYYLGGTSMATPHVAGIAALMLQQNPGLSQGTIESTLEAAALPMDSGCRMVNDGSGRIVNFCWGPGHDPAASLDADGAGFITAGAALGGGSAASSGKKK